MTKAQIISLFKYKRLDCYTWQANLGRPLTKNIVEIPARGGSTRLHNKNVAEICGIPLLAFTILTAKKMQGVDRVIINTDSEEYAELARAYGAEVPFIRPKELAGEKASLADSSFYLRRWLYDEGYPVRRMITLLPTSPFRNLDCMNHLMRKFQYFWQVQSCYFTDTLEQNRLFVKNDDGDFTRVDKGEGCDPSHATLKGLGIFSGIDIKVGKGKSVYYHTVTNPIEAIDIDLPQDLELARHVVENGLYDFGMDICAA